MNDLKSEPNDPRPGGKGRCMADAAAIKYSLGELLEEEIGMRADDF